MTKSAALSSNAATFLISRPILANQPHFGHKTLAKGAPPGRRPVATAGFRFPDPAFWAAFPARTGSAGRIGTTQGAALRPVARTTALTTPSPLRDLLAAIRPGLGSRAATGAATGATAFGVTVGLAVGGAYMMGTAARDAAVRDHAQRLDMAMTAGFTEDALADAAGGLDASILAIARRHDPYAPSARDPQAGLFAVRLDPAAGPGLRAAERPAGPAAPPFRLGGALDASRDLECLTQAVYYEARGEGREGMRAVAQVVLNRTRHAAFPRTVCSVVFQGSNRRTGCQFSFTCNGAMRGPVNRAAWNRARDVAAAALDGAVYTPVGAATHFHTTAVSPRWRGSLVRITQVGDHVFYRFGGRGGLSQQPQPSAPEAQPLLEGVDVVTAAYSVENTAPEAETTAAAKPAATGAVAAPHPEAATDAATANRTDVRPSETRPSTAARRTPAREETAPTAPAA